MNMCRLITAQLAVAYLLSCLNLSAQEIPKAAIARQAYGIDVETHIDLLVGAEEAQNHLNDLRYKLFHQAMMQFSEP